MSFDDVRKRVRASFAGVGRVLRLYPSTMLWPLLVLGLVLGIGVWGVIRVAQVEEDSAKGRAASLALDTAIWFQQQLTVAIAPVLLMSAMVEYNPQYDAVSSLFVGLAPALLGQTPSQAIKQLEYVPNGVIRDIYPLDGNNRGAAGFDLFGSEDRDGAVKTIEDNALTLVGPMNFFEGGYGVIVRKPIFVTGVDADETFNISDPLNPSCGAACSYNAAIRTKFWGFAAGLIDLDALSSAKESKLRMLASMGYRYEVRALGLVARNMSLVASSAAPPSKPVEALINLPNAEWVVRVSPEGGWSSANFGGLLAGVIVMAVALALLLFATLVSRRRHEMLLKALLPKEIIRDLRGADTSLLGPRILQAETTADLVLSMLGRLLEGYMPDLRDVVFIRQAIIRGADLYQPMNLNQHIRNANLDKDVAHALMQQLGQNAAFLLATGEDALISDEMSPAVERAAHSFTTKGMAQPYQDCSTLTGALALILTPHPAAWRDGADTVSDNAAFDSLLPARDTDAGSAASPRPSGQSFSVHAMSLVREGGGAMPSVSKGMTQSSNGMDRRGASMELVYEEEQQRRQPPGSPRGAARRSSLSLAEPSGVAWAPASIDQEVLGSEVTAESELRMSPRSASTQDDSALGTSFLVRGLPRRVESALSMVGRAGSFRRRSLLQSLTAAPDMVNSRAAATAAVAARVAVASASGAEPRASAASATEAPWELAGIDVASNRMMLAMAGVSKRSVLSPNRGLVVHRLQSLPPPLPMIEEVERVLSLASSWQFNTWTLRDVTNGHPLSALGFYLIHRAGLITHFNLKPTKLARLLRQIESGYNNNPYHSATHAADVLQTLHVIIHGAQLHVHYLDQLGLLAAYFAAIVHDYGHPGLTNDFLVATSHPLAVRYNDRSPLENHHAAASFSLLQRPGLDVLAPLSKADKMSFRKQAIDMVLATDMKQHFALLSQFSTAHRLASFAHGPTTEAPPGRSPPSSRSPGAQQLELTEIVVEADSVVTGQQAPKPLDDTERLLSLQLAIKAADLGHLGEGLDVHKRWLSGLEEEFFLQGDKERQLGIPISPLFDRAKQGVSKSQVGFYDFVALPLAHALSSAFPGSQPLMTCFLGNYNHWMSVEGRSMMDMPRTGKIASGAAGQAAVPGPEATE